MSCQHRDIYDILHEAAVGAGVEVRTGAEVVEVDPSLERAVRLASGEVIAGDVLVGADGEFGLCRAVVVGQATKGTPTGVAMYE